MGATKQEVEESVDGEVVATGGELVVTEGLALTAEGIAAAERQIVALRDAADLGGLDDARVRMETWRRAAEMHEQYVEMLRPVARLKILVEASIGLLDLEASGWRLAPRRSPLILPSGEVASGTRSTWRKLGIAQRRGVLDSVLNEFKDLSTTSVGKRLGRSGVMWVDPTLVEKAWRESGLTATELSARLGMTRHGTGRRRALGAQETISFTKAVRIAQALGVSTDDWPPFRPPPTDRSVGAKRRLAMKAALREKERHQAAKQAVRKQGGAIAELYSMAERMQDVMGQAHREATDAQRREALSLAGTHYRKMRDEIVRALGIV